MICKYSTKLIYEEAYEINKYQINYFAYFQIIATGTRKNHSNWNANKLKKTVIDKLLSWKPNVKNIECF